MLHSEFAAVTTPGTTDGCEERFKDNYKWVHLTLCMECGNIGCCDASLYKHARDAYRLNGSRDHGVIRERRELSVVLRG